MYIRTSRYTTRIIFNLTHQRDRIILRELATLDSPGANVREKRKSGKASGKDSSMRKSESVPGLLRGAGVLSSDATIRRTYAGPRRSQDSRGP